MREVLLGRSATLVVDGSEREPLAGGPATAWPSRLDLSRATVSVMPALLVLYRTKNYALCLTWHQ